MSKTKPLPRREFVVITVTTVMARTPESAARTAKKMSITHDEYTGPCSTIRAMNLTRKIYELFINRG